METEKFLKQIYKDLMKQIEENKENVFIKEYTIPSQNYNPAKEDLWFIEGIKESIKYMLEHFNNEVYFTSYKDKYFFSNSKEKAQEKMLNEVKKNEKIKKRQKQER